MFVILWQYRVRASHLEEFEVLYGPDGAWARLFHGHYGFLETQLWRDPFSQDRYLTIDLWEDEAAYRDFRTKAEVEYRRCDAAGDGLTENERFIGAFDREYTEQNWREWGAGGGGRTRTGE